MKNKIEELKTELQKELIWEIIKNKPTGDIQLTSGLLKRVDKIFIYTEIVENNLNDFRLEISNYVGNELTITFQNSENVEPQDFDLSLDDLGIDLLIEIHNLI